MDRDWDEFIGVNHEFGSVIYTDYCCREACLWSPKVLQRLLVQFRAEKSIDSEEKLEILYQSIHHVCSEIAALRIINERHPELGFSVEYSDRALSMVNGRVSFDLNMAISQSRCVASSKKEVSEKINILIKENSSIDKRMLCHGHDLMSIISFAIKKLSSQTQRMISLENIENAFFMIGLIDNHIACSSALKKIQIWATE